MGTQAYFDELHARLGKKYNIRPPHIWLIRKLFFGTGYSREDIMDWADDKARGNRKLRNGRKKQRFLELFSFLEDLSDEAWEDITQQTEYDKRRATRLLSDH